MDSIQKTISINSNLILNLPVSIAEALDKYSILEIKNKYIQNNDNIINEINTLKPLINNYLQDLDYEYTTLYIINENIWHLMDFVNKINNTEIIYNDICKKIFIENDARSRIKLKINNKINSVLKEVKGYDLKSINLICENINDTQQNIYNEYLSIYYDNVEINSNNNNKIYLNDLTNYKLLKWIDTNININFNTINMICSGSFGDLIHLLYICRYYYITQNTKTNLYLTNKFFTNFNRTLIDLQNYFINLDYINLIEEYNNQTIDLNLDLWRNNVYKTNWMDMIFNTYNIKFIKMGWIYNTNINYNLYDTILIHRSNFRNNINYNNIYKQIIENNKCKFITSNIDEYNNFIKTCHRQAGIPGEFLKNKSTICGEPERFLKNSEAVRESDIKYITYESLEDFINYASSCKSFIGNQSSPLAICYCNFNIKCLGELFEIDSIHYNNLHNYNNNYNNL
jgi:hypothetical protein